MAASKLLGVIMVFLSVMGLTLNSLAIFVFVKRKNTKTLFHRILVCLLMENNVYLLCTMFSSLYYDFEVKYLIWTLPYFAFPFRAISRTACLLTTIYLSYERFVICCDPQKLKRSGTLNSGRQENIKMTRNVIFIILFSIIYNIPKFFTYKLPTKPYQDNPKQTNLRHDPNYKLYYKGVIWGLFTVISLTILIFLNWKVYKTINQTLLVCDPTTTNNNEGISSGMTENITNKENTKMINMQFFKIMQKRHNLVLALFLLVLCNVICYSLKLAEETIQALGYDPDGLGELRMLARLMITVNTSMDALIYYISDKKFRTDISFYIRQSMAFISCGYFIKPEIKHSNSIRIIPT